MNRTSLMRAIVEVLSYVTRETWLRAAEVGQAVTLSGSLNDSDRAASIDRMRSHLSSLKEEMTTRILEKLCIAFSKDTGNGAIPIDRRVSDLEFFKATFFEKVEDGEGWALKRRAWHYPERLVPRTQMVTPDSGGAMVQAVNSGDLVVIQDIPAEIAKGGDSLWKDYWNDQGKYYSSMICYPLIRQAPGPDSTVGEIARDVLGVLTVDTNRLNYFTDDEESRAFLLEQVTPIGNCIGMLNEIDRIWKQVKDLW